jgi:hypothetical protein
VPEFQTADQQFKGASNLQNLGNGFYQFNWATPSNYNGTCRTLAIRLGGSGLVGPLPVPNSNPPLTPIPSRRYGFVNIQFKK